MAVEQYTTLGASTLNGAYTSGGVSLVVTSAASFPTSGNFRVRIDSELFKVTATSGTTFTVIGAQEGTSAANHADLAVVTEVVTALALDAIRSDQSQQGTFAALPSTTGQKDGNCYRCTDSPYTFVFNGSAWIPYAFGYKVTQPVLGDFTQVKVDLSTFDTTHGGILQSVTGAGSTIDVQSLTQAIPGSGAYYVDCACLLLTGGSSGAGPGLTGGTATSDGIAEAMFGGEGGVIWYAQRQLFASCTSFTNNTGGRTFMMSGPLVWLRVYDDRVTNRTFYVSGDGFNWQQIYQEARTTGFTPAQGALIVAPFNNAVTVHWLHFSIHA